MSWFKRLFGGTDPTPAGAAAARDVEPTRESTANVKAEAKARKSEKRTRAKTIRPIGVAKKLARNIPGAVVEDFEKRNRDDGMLARVTYTDRGVVARVAFFSVDGELGVWLETRCKGVFGAFDILHGVPCEHDEDLRERFYLAHERFVFGPRLRNEVARILTLPESIRERSVALSDKVVVVKLAEEVLSLRIADLSEFDEILDSREKGAAFVVALGTEAAAIVREFPPLPADVAVLAEARTCRFCHASFVFSPTSPVCTSCGAPGESATLMPPPPSEEIPDDPIVSDEDLEPDERREMMAGLRTLAGKLEALVGEPRMREEPERVRVFVEYTLDGRPFRAKIMEETVGIRTAAPGVMGDFYLKWAGHDGGGEDDNATAWTESERKVFFSKCCRVSSDRTTKEAARLASLPVEARTLLVEHCERHETNAQLEDEIFAIGLGHSAHANGIELVVEASRLLARVADAFPRDYDDAEVLRFHLASCTHCGWAYFLETGNDACAHCGAPSSRPS